jgi:hypothetical protein
LSIKTDDIPEALGCKASSIPFVPFQPETEVLIDQDIFETLQTTLKKGSGRSGTLQFRKDSIV